jgi:hypothetical protein
MIEALKEEKVPKSEWSAILNLEEEPEEVWAPTATIAYSAITTN